MSIRRSKSVFFYQLSRKPFGKPNYVSLELCIHSSVSSLVWITRRCDMSFKAQLMLFCFHNHFVLWWTLCCDVQFNQFYSDVSKGLQQRINSWLIRWLNAITVLYTLYIKAKSFSTWFRMMPHILKAVWIEKGNIFRLYFTVLRLCSGHFWGG